MRIKWFSLVRITGLFLVLAYHFFKSSFPGGFVGVDIFFAFSGFLITSLLIDEFARNQKIDVRGFFRRRFYRIVPPLVLMILLVMPFTFLVRRDFVAGIGVQIAAAWGFVTNFFEILSGGSYESQFVPHLFVHTWSLALEVHYYLFWGIFVWLLSKISRSAAQLRGMVFVSSVVLFSLSYASMFVGAFLSSNYSAIYFSTLTHIFPFFAGSVLGALVGIQKTGQLYQRFSGKFSKGQLILGLAGAFALLFILSFLLKFESIWTYLVGLLFSTLLALVMIFAARLLHDQSTSKKEPKIITFIADTSYGVYLFHWPFYTIFSQVMGNLAAVILTTVLSLFFTALSFYILEPMVAGKVPMLAGRRLNVAFFKKPLAYILTPLLLLTLGISLFAPQVGDFEEDLMVKALQQADNKMVTTRNQAERSAASKFDVAKGTYLIGDSVALRASEYLEEEIPGIQLDAVVSRNLESGLKVFQTAVSNHILSQNVVLALGANTVENYEEVLDKVIKKLPKGYRLILLTPYNGRGDADADLADRIRQYELELAQKYDYVFIADWYQTAQDHPEIWKGTDNVHFGSESETIKKGGTLYAQTLKKALEEAEEKGSVKQ